MRLRVVDMKTGRESVFPFLFGRAFIEALSPGLSTVTVPAFPFLFGRAFIEA